jgi:hypothetical protein
MITNVYLFDEQPLLIAGVLGPHLRSLAFIALPHLHRSHSLLLPLQASMAELTGLRYVCRAHSYQDLRAEAWLSCDDRTG